MGEPGQILPSDLPQPAVEEDAGEKDAGDYKPPLVGSGTGIPACPQRDGGFSHDGGSGGGKGIDNGSGGFGGKGN